MDIPTIVLLMIVCLIVEAFFSGSEIGVVSADRIKLRHDAAKGSSGAKLAVEMLEKPEWLLSTTLVGTNIAIVTNTSLATLLAIQLFGREYSGLAVVLVAPLIWVFGEIVPKSVFQQRADYLTPRIIFVLKGASYLFYPILLLFSTLTRLFTKLVGGNEENPFTLREEIELMLRMPSAKGDIEPMEKTMIRRMFHFGETRVRDIAVPLIDVICVHRSATVEEVLNLAWNHSHMILPVHEGRVDQVVGTIDALKLMHEADDAIITPFIHPVRFVPGSKSIEDLFFTFRESGDHMAVVVDEFGGAEGIITLEDILERIVGEMEDEYDEDKPSTQWVKRLDERSLLVNPRIDLKTLNEKSGIKLPDGNYETLAGFLLEKLGDIPQAGQVIPHQNIVFTIENASHKAIREVSIRFDTPK